MPELPRRFQSRGLELVSPIWPWSGYVGQGDGTLRVSSPWGERTHPVTGAKKRFHNGCDLAIPVGVELRPVAVGRVQKVWDDDDINGHAIRIEHVEWWSSYVHLSRVDVHVGQTVSPSMVIGLSGGAKGAVGSGRSTGPHLHLSVWVADDNGRPETVDPVPVIDWRPLTLTGAV